MGGEYQAYPESKDSGVEWVGKIPIGWDIKPLFSTVSTNAEKNVNGVETNVLSLSYGNIIKRDVETNFGLLPASFDTYQLIYPGDLVLRLTDLQNDKRSLRVGLAKEKGIITSAYLKLIARSEDFESRFLYRQLHSYDTTKVFYGMGGGLRQSMKFEDMRRLPLLVPPIAEQTKISNFLDHETVKIDTLIDKQQQLIALLKEKRQAVISHAVTKGLNPDAPMKDSGFEWLGEVPEHWVVMQIRRVLLEMEQGKSPECESRSAEDDEWGVLKTSCVNKGDYNSGANKALPPHVPPFPQFEVKKGDLLMSRASGSVDLIGSVAYVYETRSKILLSDKVFRLHTSKKVNRIFFSYLMQSSFMRENIKQAISGAEGMANNITKGAVVGFKFALPPVDEQEVIQEHISSICKNINILIYNSEKALQLLRERRTALISAAVTGKIDVRNWQQPTKTTADKDTQ